MTYLGNAVTQLDGSKYAHQNCVLATTSVLGDTSTLGFHRITPARLRVLSGDTLGGVTYTTAAKTILGATNNEVKLTVLYWAPQNSTESTLDDILDARRATALSIDCSVTRYTPFRTGTFTGGHTITVGAKRYVTITRSDGSTYRQKQAYVMDSGHSTAKWVWWPWSLLIKAAKARTGNNTIHVMYTRDVTNVTRVAASDGPIRSSATIANNKVGMVYKGKSYVVLDTVKGSAWTVDGRTGTGWSKLGAGKFVSGGRLR